MLCMRICAVRGRCMCGPRRHSQRRRCRYEDRTLRLPQMPFSSSTAGPRRGTGATGDGERPGRVGGRAVGTMGPSGGPAESMS